MTARNLPLTFHAQVSLTLRDEAVRLLLRERSPEARAVLAELSSVESMAARPADAFAVLTRGPQVVAALFNRREPGSFAELWSPRSAPGEPAETAIALVQHVVADLQQAGVRLVQAFADTNLAGDERILEAAGFSRITDLLYLVWLSESRDGSSDSSSTRLVLEPYCEALHGRLADVIERTYEGTRDCPQLDGARSIEDVLAGYRACGTFDPARWLLAQRDGRDVGCLLLTEHPQTKQWELVYLGVVPEARGNGLGRQLVREAQRRCHAAGVGHLVLAVDTDNAPAVQLYVSAGFVAWDRRPVYMQILAPHAANSGNSPTS